jgi:hypothetical protein
LLFSIGFPTDGKPRPEPRGKGNDPLGRIGHSEPAQRGSRSHESESPETERDTSLMRLDNGGWERITGKEEVSGRSHIQPSRLLILITRTYALNVNHLMIVRGLLRQ